MFSSKKIKNFEKKELLKEESANDDFEKPGCCLMFCICPWRPQKVYSYLVGSRSSEQKGNIKLGQQYKYEPLADRKKDINKNQRSFKQNYYNTFRKGLLPKTSPLSSGKKGDSAVNEKNEFESPNTTTPAYDFSVSLVVESTAYSFHSKISFYDNNTTMAMAPLHIAINSPVIEQNTDVFWVRYALDESNFILCVVSELGFYHVLASLDGVNLTLQTADSLLSSNSSTKYYVWSLNNLTIAQEVATKIILQSTSSSSPLYCGRSTGYQIVLTPHLENAIDWEIIQE